MCLPSQWWLKLANQRARYNLLVIVKNILPIVFFCILLTYVCNTKEFQFFTGVRMAQNVVESRLTFIWRKKKSDEQMALWIYIVKIL